VDMTPILRKSKESARKMRAKPLEERRRSIPLSEPLCAGHSGGGTAGAGGRSRLSDGRDLLDRKRRAAHDERYYQDRNKYSRRDQSYGRSYSHRGGGGGGGYFGHQVMHHYDRLESYPPPPPRYYEDYYRGGRSYDYDR